MYLQDIARLLIAIIFKYDRNHFIKTVRWEGSSFNGKHTNNFTSIATILITEELD